MTAEEKIQLVLDYLDQCAILRVEPSKYKIRQLLTGESDGNS